MITPSAALTSPRSVKGDEQKRDVFVIKLQLDDALQLAGRRVTVVVIEWRRSACVSGGDNMASLSSLQRTDVNDNLFNWPVTMETFYKSIPAIHTEEH